MSFHLKIVWNWLPVNLNEPWLIVTNVAWLCTRSLTGPVGVWTWIFSSSESPGNKKQLPFTYTVNKMRGKKTKNRVGTDEGNKKVGDSYMFSSGLPARHKHTWQMRHVSGWAAANVLMTMLQGQWWQAKTRLHQVLVGGCWADVVTGNKACSGRMIDGVGWTIKVINVSQDYS